MFSRYCAASASLNKWTLLLSKQQNGLPQLLFLITSNILMTNLILIILTEKPSRSFFQCFAVHIIIINIIVIYFALLEGMALG